MVMMMIIVMMIMMMRRRCLGKTSADSLPSLSKREDGNFIVKCDETEVGIHMQVMGTSLRRVRARKKVREIWDAVSVDFGGMAIRRPCAGGQGNVAL